MNFEDYWDRLARATPGLSQPTITMRIKVQTFRDAVRRAYQTGREDGYQQGRADELENQRRQARTDQGSLDWLTNLFGSK